MMSGQQAAWSLLAHSPSCPAKTGHPVITNVSDHWICRFRGRRRGERFGETNPRSSAPAVELRHLEVLPAGYVGDFRARLAVGLGGVDADRRRGAARPRLGRIVDRGVGGTGRDLIDYEDVALRL